MRKIRHCVYMKRRTVNNKSNKYHQKWWRSLQFAFRHFFFRIPLNTHCSPPPPENLALSVIFKYYLGELQNPKNIWKQQLLAREGATANIVYYEGFDNRQLRNAWKSRVISDLKQTRFLTEKKFLRCWAVALQYKFFTLTSSYKLRSKTPCLSSLLSLGQGKIHKQVKDFKYSRRMTHCLYTEA